MCGFTIVLVKSQQTLSYECTQDSIEITHAIIYQGLYKKQLWGEYVGTKVNNASGFNLGLCMYSLPLSQSNKTQYLLSGKRQKNTRPR